MLIAKPASEKKIRELANELAESNPNISVDSFMLPRDESCNYQWNTVSTRSFSLLLEWYLCELGLLSVDHPLQEEVLSEFLEGIIHSNEHTVIIDGNPKSITLDYLRQDGNWISNFTAVSLLRAVSEKLGPEYADKELAILQITLG